MIRKKPTDALAPSEKRATSGRIERWAARCFFALVSLLVALVLAEVGSYWVWGAYPHLTGWEFPVENTRVPQPYVVFGGDASFHNVAQVNPLGYRGRQPTLDKPLGEYRIFILGGSTVFHGAPPLAPLIEKALWRHGQPLARVYNWGCVSQITGQELARVVHQILEFQPDLVLHYSGGNDVWMPFEHDPRPNHPYNFLVYEGNPLLDMPGAWRRGVLGVLGASNLVRHLGGVAYIDAVVPREPIRQRIGAYSTSWQDEIAGHYVGNLLKSHFATRGFGAQTVGMLQPHTCYLELTDALGYADVNTHRDLIIHFGEVRRRILRLAQAATAEHGLVFHDLSRLLFGRPANVFEDSVHVRQDVHPDIAEEIALRLLESMPPRAGSTAGSVPGGLQQARAWVLESEPAAEARVNRSPSDPRAIRVEQAERVDLAATQVRLSRRLLPLGAGRRYRVGMRLKADRPRGLSIGLGPWTDQGRPTGQEQALSLDENWQQVTLEWTSPRQELDLNLELQLGADSTAVELADAWFEDSSLSPSDLPDAVDGDPSYPAVVRENFDRSSQWFLQTPDPVEAWDQTQPGAPSVRRLQVGTVHGPAELLIRWRRRWGPLAAADEQRLVFSARSDSPRQLNAAIEPWESRLFSQADSSPIRGQWMLTPEWTDYYLDFIPGGETLLSLSLSVESRPGWIEIDQHRCQRNEGWPFEVRAEAWTADTAAADTTTPGNASEDAAPADAGTEDAGTEDAASGAAPPSADEEPADPAADADRDG